MTSPSTAAGLIEAQINFLYDHFDIEEQPVYEWETEVLDTYRELLDQEAARREEE